MILKLLWISIMFLVITGIIFIASFGIPVQDAFYEKTDIVITNDE